MVLEENYSESVSPCSSPEKEMQFEQTFERIKKSTGTRTQVELAEILNIRQSSISDAKRRCSIPADWYLKLYRKYGLNPDWLEYGIDPVYLKAVEGQIPSEMLEGMATYGRSHPQPRGKIVEAYTMAGVEPEVSDWAKYALEKIYIPEKFSKPGLRVIKMDGTSMEPLVRRGAYVGVDESQRNFLSGEVYAIFAPHQGLVLKRVFWDPENNRFILKAEDEKHPEQYLPLEEQEKSILGRVVWVLQEL